MKPLRRVVRAFLFYDGAFLLVEQHSGVYVIPGGGIEGGEKPLQALRRELKEELGLSDDDYRIHTRSSFEHAFSIPESEQKAYSGQKELLFIGELLNVDAIVTNTDEIRGWKFGGVDDLSFPDMRSVANKVLAEFEQQ